MAPMKLTSKPYMVTPRQTKFLLTVKWATLFSWASTMSFLSSKHCRPRISVATCFPDDVAKFLQFFMFYSFLHPLGNINTISILSSSTNNLFCSSECFFSFSSTSFSFSRLNSLATRYKWQVTLCS